MTLQQTINKRYAPLFVAAKEYVPTVYTGLIDGIQSVKAGDPFTINAPIAGWMKDTSRMNPPDNTEDNAFILRTVVGYSAMARVAGDKAVGALIISNLINQCLTSIYLKYGERVALLSFDSEKEPGVFLRELENNAGYSLQVTGSLFPNFYEDDIEV